MSALPLFEHRADDPFPIETGVPISSDRSPRRDDGAVKPDIVPVLERLQPGESFVVRSEHCGGVDLLRAQNIVTGIISAYKQGFKPDARPSFTTRQQGGKFVRVWRKS